MDGINNVQLRTINFSVILAKYSQNTRKIFAKYSQNICKIPTEYILANRQLARQRVLIFSYSFQKYS